MIYFFESSRLKGNFSKWHYFADQLKKSLTISVSVLTEQKGVKSEFWTKVHIGLLSNLKEKELLEPALKRALISADGTRCEDWIRSNMPKMDDMRFEFKE